MVLEASSQVKANEGKKKARTGLDMSQHVIWSHRVETRRELSFTFESSVFDEHIRFSGFTPSLVPKSIFSHECILENS